MTQELFTVPITQSYVDPLTHVPYYFKAGDLVPLDRAIELQMPGAVADALPTPFSDSEIAWLDARYVAVEVEGGEGGGGDNPTPGIQFVNVQHFGSVTDAPTSAFTKSVEVTYENSLLIAICRTQNDSVSGMTYGGSDLVVQDSGNMVGTLWNPPVGTADLVVSSGGDLYPAGFVLCVTGLDPTLNASFWSGTSDSINSDVTFSSPTDQSFTGLKIFCAAFTINLSDSTTGVPEEGSTVLWQDLETLAGVDALDCHYSAAVKDADHALDHTNMTWTGGSGERFFLSSVLYPAT